MLRQYNPQRFRHETIGGRVRCVGLSPVGSIHRTPWGKVMVLAWLPRKMHYPTRYNLRAGHLALVRDLATGRAETLAEQFLTS